MHFTDKASANVPFVTNPSVLSARQLTPLGH